MYVYVVKQEKYCWDTPSHLELCYIELLDTAKYTAGLHSSVSTTSVCLDKNGY